MQTEQTAVARLSRSSTKNSRSGQLKESDRLITLLLITFLLVIWKEPFNHHVIVYAWSLPRGAFQAWVSEVRKKPRPPNDFPRGHESSSKIKRIRKSRASLIIFELSSHDAEDGAVIRNIEACQAISKTVQTSLGPYGRNKIVINHLQKMILTSDAASILRELDVVHPAAKLLVMASQQQDAEMGDGTNMVIVLAGELLKKAEEVLRLGLKTSDIVQGYEKAQNFALKTLEGGFYIQS